MAGKQEVPADEKHRRYEQRIEGSGHRGIISGPRGGVQSGGTLAATSDPVIGNPMTESAWSDRDPIAQAIFALLEERGPGKSICPSEAARHLQQARARPDDPADAWRRLLPAVRQQAIHLARQGRLSILRKGRPVDPQGPIKGVIRLALTEPD